MSDSLLYQQQWHGTEIRWEENSYSFFIGKFPYNQTFKIQYCKYCKANYHLTFTGWVFFIPEQLLETELSTLTGWLPVRIKWKFYPIQKRMLLVTSVQKKSFKLHVLSSPIILVTLALVLFMPLYQIEHSLLNFMHTLFFFNFL